MNNDKSILYGIIGLLGGVLLTIIFTTSVVNSNNTVMMKMMGMHAENSFSKYTDSDTHMMSEGYKMHDMDMEMTMDSMTGKLMGKKGDEFDKIFISEMIMHHQGAIDMAKLAKENALHDELKSLSGDIITAQTKEIEMMKQWQKDWGY